jgi:hypothetical protein
MLVVWMRPFGYLRATSVSIVQVFGRKFGVLKECRGCRPQACVLASSFRPQRAPMDRSAAYLSSVAVASCGGLPKARLRRSVCVIGVGGLFRGPSACRLLLRPQSAPASARGVVHRAWLLGLLRAAFCRWLMSGELLFGTRTVQAVN